MAKSRLNLIPLILIISSFYLYPNAFAQVPDVSGQMATPIPGVGHHYLGLSGDIVTEMVNPATGSVSVHITLPTPSARGINFPFSLIYDSSGVNQLIEFIDNQAWITDPGVGSGVGWTYSVPLLTAMSAQSTGVMVGSNDGTGNGQTYTCNYFVNYVLQDESGTRHSLQISSAQQFPLFPGCQYVNNPPTNVTAGGDDYYWATTTAMLAGTPPPVTVVGNDGTVYTFDGLAPINSNLYPSINSWAAPPSQIEDRNGNVAHMSSTNGTLNLPGGISYTDSTGRTAFSITPVDSSSKINTISVSGLAGPVSVQWGTATASFSGTGYQQFSNSSGGCDGNQYSLTGSVRSTLVIQSITLPDSQSYTFTYDPVYGLLQKITYPSGAYIQYTWGINALAEAFNASYFTPLYTDSYPGNVPGAYGQTQDCSMSYGVPAVIARDVSYDGNTVAEHQTFQYSTAWGDVAVWTSKTTTVHTTDEVRNTPATTTVYTYAPGSVPESPNVPRVWLATPLEVSVQEEDSNAAILRTTTQNWFDQYEQQCNMTTLAPGITSGTFFTYGPWTQIIEKQEFDYGQLSPNACDDMANLGHPATGPGTTIPKQATKIAYDNISRLPNGGMLFTAPSSVSTYDGGTLVGKTDIYYDENPITSVTAVQHDDTAYSSSVVSGRGNPTTIIRRCWPSCSDSSSSFTWDATGELASYQDANGNITTFSHKDKFASGTAPGNTNAFLTAIHPPAVNGVDHSTYASYDYTSGHLVSSIDSNGHTSQYQFNDPLDRLTKIIGPADPNNGNQSETVSYRYQDGGAKPSITTSQLLNAQGLTKTTVEVMDGIGHPIGAQLTSDPGGIVYTDTTYDGLGRTYTVSTPYRNSMELTYGVTTYSYDVLGRTLNKTNPDTSAESTSYNGNIVTFTDENKNQWQRTSDAFGRLLQVLEPNGISSTASMETDYGYDGLSNVVTVMQWGGASGSGAANGPILRSFSYNSLSRLLTANNPETGTVCYGLAAGSTCTRGYDGNGNLIHKTDVRGMVTTYAYDGLNRILSKSYSNDPSGTQFSCYQYDSSSVVNGIDRLANQWTQSATRGFCAVTAPTSGFWTKRSILAYDVAGHISSESQYTPSNSVNGTPYAPSYTYDLAGNVTTSTDGTTPIPVNGSNLAFGMAVDGAGRLQTVTSNWIDSRHPATLFSAQSNTVLPCGANSVSAAYTAFGGLSNAQFGNDLLLNRSYDKRLRNICEMDSATASSTNGSTTVTITGAEQSK